MKKKICHIFSDVQNGSFFEALAASNDKSRYDVCFVMVAERPNAFFESLKQQGHEIHFVRFSNRKKILGSIIEMRRLLLKLKPTIVLTHLVNASLVGLIAARLCGIKKLVSYRHHSIECHTYYPHAVYYDKAVNYLSTFVVANTQMTAEILIEKEGLPPEKVRVINYAYHPESFAVSERSVNELKQRYDLTDNSPVVGVVSRFVHWKGVQFIIPAFRRLAEDYPNAKLVLANATGSYSKEIDKILTDNLTGSQYLLIDFEKDIFSLYRSFDVFVHVPIDRYVEAFGQTYVEALMLEVPSVFTLSGIANDFIVDNKNAVVVAHQDSNAIYEAMKRILTEPETRENIVREGKKNVLELFQYERLGKQLDLLYSEL